VSEATRSTTAPSAPITEPEEGWSASEVTALSVVAILGVIVALTTSLLVPILPELSAQLGPNTQWLLTITLLVGAVAVPVFGRLADLYGKRLMLVAAAAALTIGSLICALSDTLTWLIVGRAVTGLATAAIPLGVSLIGTVLSPKRAGTGIALVSATLGIGGALGLPLAAFIAEHTDYHVLFWICVVGGSIGVVGVLAVLREVRTQTEGSLDLPGAVLLAAALVSLLLPLAKASAWGWGDPRTIGLLVAAGVLLVTFVLVERRMSSPLVDMVTNARPALLLTNVASVCVGFALFASLIGTASYVQAPEASGYGFGSSVLTSGLCLLPSGVAMILLSPVSAKLSQRFGPKITLALGAAVIAVGFLGRIVFTGALWEIIAFTTVAGAGTGIAYAAMPSLVLRAAPASELAAANGLNTLARSVGSSLASAIGGTLLAASTIALGPAVLPSLTAYRILFAVCAGAALLGAFISLVIPAADLDQRDAVPA
jgi:MFS family permease